MPVRVFFVDGTNRDFPSATSAHADGSEYRLRIWNPKKRKSEDLQILSSETVLYGEVSEHGVVTEKILGLGGRQRSN